MPGRLIHFEIPAQDTKRARRFYGELFEWDFKRWDGPWEYHLTEAGGTVGGAVFDNEQAGLEQRIRVHFKVDDLPAAIARVRELGGEADDISHIEGVGWFSGCADLEGNPFTLYASDPPPDA